MKKLMKNQNSFVLGAFKNGFTCVEVYASIDEQFVHRAARQDALMFLYSEDNTPTDSFFGDDVSWQTYYRYYVDKDRTRANFTHRFVFYIFKSSADKRVLRSILTYFNFEVIRVTEVFGIEDKAFTKYDLHRIFRYGNKYVKKLVAEETCPIDLGGSARRAFDRFLEIFAQSSEVGEYFVDLASNDVAKAIDRYYRPITRGRDGLLYSAADMDAAMMSGC